MRKRIIILTLLLLISFAYARQELHISNYIVGGDFCQADGTNCNFENVSYNNGSFNKLYVNLDTYFYNYLNCDRLTTNGEGLLVCSDMLDYWNETELLNGTLLTSYTDTNASTACNDGDYLDGSGLCLDLNVSINASSLWEKNGIIISPKDNENISTTGLLEGGDLEIYMEKGVFDASLHTETWLFAGVFPILELVFNKDQNAKLGSIRNILYIRGILTTAQLIFSNADLSNLMTMNYNFASSILAFSGAEKYTFDKDVSIINDNEKLCLGNTGSVSCFYQDGTNAIINPDEEGAGNLTIDGNLKITSKTTTNDFKVGDNQKFIEYSASELGGSREVPILTPSDTFGGNAGLLQGEWGVRGISGNTKFYLYPPIGNPCIFEISVSISENLILNCPGDFTIKDNLHVNGTLVVRDNVNVTGTITGDSIRGEIWNRTSGGYTFTPTDAGTYYNLTGGVDGSFNGVTSTYATQANGGSYLTVLNDGVYRANLYISGHGTVAGGQYGISIAKNFNQELTRNCYINVDGTGSVNVININCFIELDAGDTINVKVEDEADPTKAFSIHSWNLNIERAGNK